MIFSLEELDEHVVVSVQFVLLFGWDRAIEIDTDTAQHILHHGRPDVAYLQAFVPKLLLAIEIYLLYNGLATL